MLEILLKSNEYKEVTLNLEQNILLIGKDNIFKTKILNDLKDGFNGKNKNMFINGTILNYKDYNFINIDEENDFFTEFKFSKNNILKQIIYDDIINKIDDREITDCANEIFDIIDNKLNKLLDKNINKELDNNISFQIEIPSINSIIDKFTNIYIDEKLIDDREITKSMKRKFLYQLYFWKIKLNKDKNNIIIIDNFDVYFNHDEVINILRKINKLTCENCHFILTTSSNIFEYIDLNIFNVYKLNNSIIPLKNIDYAIKNYIIKQEYNKIRDKSIDYEYFFRNSEKLIQHDEILKIKNRLFNRYPDIIGKVLNSSSIKFVSSKPQNITSEYIICQDKDMQNLFSEIALKFID